MHTGYSTENVNTDRKHRSGDCAEHVNAMYNTCISCINNNTASWSQRFGPQSTRLLMRVNHGRGRRAGRCPRCSDLTCPCPAPVFFGETCQFASPPALANHATNMQPVSLVGMQVFGVANRASQSRPVGVVSTAPAQHSHTRPACTPYTPSICRDTTQGQVCWCVN